MRLLSIVTVVLQGIGTTLLFFFKEENYPHLATVEEVNEESEKGSLTLALLLLELAALL